VGSEPDGHTITLVAAPSTVVTPLIQDVCYGPAHFATIGVITEVPSVLAVGAPSEFSDAAAFFAAARARPGELTVGTPGAATSQAIELRRPASEYGVKVTVVSRSTAMPSSSGPCSVAPSTRCWSTSHRTSGRSSMRASSARVAVSPAERVGYLPDTPTLAELGFPGLTYSTSLFGLGAPVGTPPRSSRAGGGDARRPGRPGRRTQLDEAYVPDRFIGAAEFRAMLDEIVTVYGPVAKELRGG
jgi:tripartite-type tricarboxylate transporter receptor subunit TctC